MKPYETLNLHGLGPKTQEEFIDFNKLMSTVRNTNNVKNNKNKRCFICKKKNVKFCSSHTIPQFVLKNISNNGKLNNTQIFNSAKLIKTENGISNVQTFCAICKDCDNRTFKEYETPENLQKEPTQNIMKQIALKNHIARLSKHNKEKSMQARFLNLTKNKNHKFAKDLIDQTRPVVEYNLCYNRKQANNILKLLNSDIKLYKLCYYKKLEYVAPYTIQSNSILPLGFDDKLLVDGFKLKDLDMADDIHLCIYPLKNQTIVSIFCSININVYDEFFNVLKEKELLEQLSILNFIAFAYFEDIYLHQNLDSSVLNNEYLQKLTHEQMITICNKPMIKGLSALEREQAQLECLNKNFSISNHSKIPNLLDEKYKIVT